MQSKSATMDLDGGVVFETSRSKAVPTKREMRIQHINPVGANPIRFLCENSLSPDMNILS